MCGKTRMTTNSFYKVKNTKYVKCTCGTYDRFHEKFGKLFHVPMWKITIKRDYDFYGKSNIFSVKSTFLQTKILMS